MTNQPPDDGSGGPIVPIVEISSETLQAAMRTKINIGTVGGRDGMDFGLIVLRYGPAQLASVMTPSGLETFAGDLLRLAQVMRSGVLDKPGVYSPEGASPAPVEPISTFDVVEPEPEHAPNVIPFTHKEGA